jgi:hypothetical protein
MAPWSPKDVGLSVIDDPDTDPLKLMTSAAPEPVVKLAVPMKVVPLIVPMTDSVPA